MRTRDSRGSRNSITRPCLSRYTGLAERRYTISAKRHLDSMADRRASTKFFRPAIFNHIPLVMRCEEATGQIQPRPLLALTTCLLSDRPVDG